MAVARGQSSTFNDWQLIGSVIWGPRTEWAVPCGKQQPGKVASSIWLAGCWKLKCGDQIQFRILSMFTIKTQSFCLLDLFTSLLPVWIFIYILTFILNRRLEEDNWQWFTRKQLANITSVQWGICLSGYIANLTSSCSGTTPAPFPTIIQPGNLVMGRPFNWIKPGIYMISNMLFCSTIHNVAPELM